MLKIPKLEVITKDNRRDSTSLEQIIMEKRLLKTKIKLIHIATFDNDLKSLNEVGLDIKDLKISDFKLTPSYELFVPVYDHIDILGDDSKTKLISYLIYLSYLYNIDLVTLYKENYHLFYEIIISIELPVDIKMSIFALIKYNDGFYFSDIMADLNNAEFRENLERDKQVVRKLTKNVK